MVNNIITVYGLRNKFFNDPLSVFWNTIDNFRRPFNIDRFNIVNQWSPINFGETLDRESVLSSFKEVNESLDFEQCLADRVAEFERHYKQEQFIVMYSGGCDSLGIVASILKYGSSDLISRCNIICSQDSIDEYPAGPELFKKNNLKVNYTEAGYVVPYLRSAPQKLILHGMCGDFIYNEADGIVKVRQKLMPWKEGIKDRLLELNPELESERIEDIIHIFEEMFHQIHEYVGEIVTYTDAMWFIYFAMKWTWFLYRPDGSYYQYCINNKIPDIPKTFIDFYDTINLQHWGMQNFRYDPQRDSSEDSTKYRKEIKDVIFDVFKDPDYLHKEKAHSFRTQTQSHVIFRNYPLVLSRQNKVNTYFPLKALRRLETTEEKFGLLKSIICKQ